MTVRAAQPPRWVIESVLAERDRWPLWLPVAFGGGILLYFGLDQEPPLQRVAALSIALAMALWWARRRAAPWVGLRFMCLLALFVSLGLTAATLRTHWVGAPLLTKAIGPLTVVGTVTKIDPYPDGARLHLVDLDILSKNRTTLPAKVRVRLRGDQPPVQPGDRVAVRVKLLPPSAPALPGGFDFQRHAFFQAIGATGFAYGAATVLDDVQRDSLALRLEALRHAVTARIVAALPDETGAIAAALITGHRTLVPEEQLEIFRRAGIAHLLAISGLHIGLVAGFVFFAARLLLVMVPGVALRLATKKWAAGAAILAALGYALLAGWTVPTQRAFLITGAVLLAVIVDRRGISLRLLAGAAFFILALQPEAILSASFQMSFAAALALVSAYEALRARADMRPRDRDRTQAERILLYIGGVALTTVIAGLATAPFALHHFNQVAGAGNLVNLVAVPLTGFWVMPFAFISLLALPFGLEGWPLAVMGSGIELILAAASPVAAYDQSVHQMARAPNWVLLSAVFGLIWLALWRSSRLRLLGLIGLVGWALGQSLNDPPDLLISAKADVIAVRADDGQYYRSNLRAGRRNANAWQRAGGLTGEMPHWRDLLGATGETKVRCDAVGCRFRLKGVEVSYVQKASALLEDCWRDDLSMIISAVPVSKTCRRGGLLIIDRFDVWAKGAHAVWVGNGQPHRVQAVLDQRGDRPWVLRPDGVTNPKN